MFIQKTRSGIVALCIVALGTTLLAACDQAATSPEPTRSLRPLQQSHHDDILGDTLSCKSGFVVINGRYVCN
jgi:hypothetical protein